MNAFIFSVVDKNRDEFSKYIVGKLNIGGQKYYDVEKTMYGCNPLTRTRAFM